MKIGGRRGGRAEDRPQNGRRTKFRWWKRALRPAGGDQLIFENNSPEEVSLAARARAFSEFKILGDLSERLRLSGSKLLLCTQKRYFRQIQFNSE